MFWICTEKSVWVSSNMVSCGLTDIDDFALSWWNFRSQVRDHSYSLFRSSCSSTMSSSLAIILKTLLPSANIKHEELSSSGRSFMNRRDPSTLPCGTPLTTVSALEQLPFRQLFGIGRREMPWSMNEEFLRFHTIQAFQVDGDGVPNQKPSKNSGKLHQHAFPLQ